jgi:hypothetical protein
MTPDTMLQSVRPGAPPHQAFTRHPDQGRRHMMHTQIKINIPLQHCQHPPRVSPAIEVESHLVCCRRWPPLRRGCSWRWAVSTGRSFSAGAVRQPGCGVTAHLVLLEPGPELINILETITTRFDSGANRCCRRISRFIGVVTLSTMCWGCAHVHSRSGLDRAAPLCAG